MRTTRDIGEADVVDIEADAVLRVVRNPDGCLSQTGDGYAYQLQSDLSSGKLTITDEEWEILGVKPATRMTVIVPNLVAPCEVQPSPVAGSRVDSSTTPGVT